MRIKATIGEWQISEFLEILKRNKLKKNSSEYVKHLIMFGEAKANAEYLEGEASFHYRNFVEAYKKYWRLK